MKIAINGETSEFAGGTVAQLLAAFGIDPARVAVELNLDILPKGDYAGTELKDGDRIEIVHFVGGG